MHSLFTCSSFVCLLLVLTSRWAPLSPSSSPSVLLQSCAKNSSNNSVLRISFCEHFLQLLAVGIVGSIVVKLLFSYALGIAVFVPFYVNLNLIRKRRQNSQVSCGCMIPLIIWATIFSELDLTAIAVILILQDISFNISLNATNSSRNRIIEILSLCQIFFSFLYIDHCGILYLMCFFNAGINVAMGQKFSVLVNPSPHSSFK